MKAIINLIILLASMHFFCISLKADSASMIIWASIAMIGSIIHLVTADCTEMLD